MTTVSDNFVRANNASLGANWTDWSTGHAQIVSNQACGSGAFQCGDYWTANTFLADHYSEVTAAALPSSGSVWMGPTVRQTALGKGYLLIYLPGTGFMMFNQTAPGSSSQIGSTVAGTLAVNDVLRLDASGTTLKAYKNGTLLMTVTDASWSSGSPGLAFYGTSSTSGAVSLWTGSDSGGSPVNIDTTSVANVVQNVSVRRWFIASGGVGPYTWSITSGALPAGMTLSSSGELSGTPTATGTSTFTVKAADTNAAFMTKSLSITVVSAPFSPSSSSTDANGVITWAVTSAINMGSAESVRVLNPTTPNLGYTHAFMLVLPVNTGTDDTTYGNGLDTIRTLALHNQYNVTVIEPSTGGNWLADNPSNSALLQETYLLQVVAWAKANYGSAGDPIYVVGFSRSGIAAQGLFLHRPDVYAGVGTWDFPGMMSDYDGTDANGTVGGSPASSYGTSDNFHANYWLSSANLSKWMAGQNFNSVKRMWIGGHNFFALDVNQYDAVLTTAGILHTYDNVAASAHNWSPTPQWLPSAFLGLRGQPAGNLMFMASGII